MTAPRPGYEAATGLETEESHVRIVITGASGNVGSALVGGSPDGDTSWSGSPDVHPDTDQGSASVEWHAADLGTSRRAARLERVFKSGRGGPPRVGLPALARPELPRGARRRRLPPGAARRRDAGVEHLVHMSSVVPTRPGATTCPSTRTTHQGVPVAVQPAQGAAERLLDGFEKVAPARHGHPTAARRRRPRHFRQRAPAVRRPGPGPGLAPRARARAAVRSAGPHPDGARRRRRRRAIARDLDDACARRLQPGCDPPTPRLTNRRRARCRVDPRALTSPAPVMSAGWHARLAAGGPGLDRPRRCAVPLLDSRRARASSAGRRRVPAPERPARGDHRHGRRGVRRQPGPAEPHGRRPGGTCVPSRPRRPSSGAVSPTPRSRPWSPTKQTCPRRSRTKSRGQPRPGGLSAWLNACLPSWSR